MRGFIFNTASEHLNQIRIINKNVATGEANYCEEMKSPTASRVNLSALNNNQKTKGGKKNFTFTSPTRRGISYTLNWI